MAFKSLNLPKFCHAPYHDAARNKEPLALEHRAVVTLSFLARLFFSLFVKKQGNRASRKKERNSCESFMRIAAARW
jgi:hypothetical protein